MRTSNVVKSPLIATTAVAIVLVGCVHRQVIGAAPDRAEPGDPPSRVARLSYLSGVVSLSPAGIDDWTPAVLNRPLTSGDRLWTESAARAELHVGTAALRLDSRTAADLLTLDDRVLQVKLAEGVLALSVRGLDPEESIEIDTPAAAISALRAGDYRVEVSPDGDQTRIIVRAGQVEVTAPGQAFAVQPGQQGRLSGADPVRYEITPAPARDTFDEFSLARDRREERAESAKYVAPSVIGWEDLDEYGAWSVHVSYGPVWAPRTIAPGWAPYRFGRWVWIEPWGWTWIDDAPWGFAPFHYGRWIFVDGRWIWIPGPVRVRAIYAPALVVFIGGGPGLHHYFRVGAGIGVAWFPLGPREIYIPPYRASRIYVTHVNTANARIDPGRIHQTEISRQRYENRIAPGAVTAVPEDIFHSGRPVSRSAIAVSRREAETAHIGGMAPPAVPTRRSVAPPPESSGSPVRSPDRPARRSVVVERIPAPAAVPFEKKQRALESNPGRPPDRRAVDELRREQPARQPEYRPARPSRTEPATPRAAETAAPRDRGAREQEKRRTAIERERRGAEAAPRDRKGK